MSDIQITSKHHAGVGRGYTATRRPIKLLHAEEFETRYEALTMERKLKGWSRAKKLAYVRNDWNAICALPKARHESERKDRKPRSTK